MNNLNLCLNHKEEANYSQYAEHDCDYCRAKATIQELEKNSRKDARVIRELEERLVEARKFLEVIYAGDEPWSLQDLKAFLAGNKE